MGFSKGNLEMVCEGKRSVFDGYDMKGDCVADGENKRGWIVEIYDGLERGTFTVFKDQIYRTSLQTHGVDRNAYVVLDSKEADIRDSARKAIFAAIAQWNSECKTPCT
jgi:hypothetical protein